jgi:hypothetical protein
MEGCPAGTGRSWKIGSEAGRGAGLRGAGASTTAAATAGASTTGTGGSGAAGAASAGRATARAVTGRSRATGAGDADGGFAAGGLAAGGFAAGAFAAVGEALAGLVLGRAGGFSTVLSRTVRTRSAIWSGTTLSWFFASKTPPKRSLKSAVSSFEVSPTSFASSKIRTFPAKFTLERRAPESHHQLECAEPQPMAWLR